MKYLKTKRNRTETESISDWRQNPGPTKNTLVEREISEHNIVRLLESLWLKPSHFSLKGNLATVSEKEELPICPADFIRLRRVLDLIPRKQTFFHHTFLAPHLFYFHIVGECSVRLIPFRINFGNWNKMVKGILFQYNQLYWFIFGSRKFVISMS